MIKAYIKLAGKPLAGSQLLSNEAIRHMNRKHGWIVVGYAESPNGALELVYHPGKSKAKPGTDFIKDTVIRYLLAKYGGTTKLPETEVQESRKNEDRD
jgi:hypothetical protein